MRDHWLVRCPNVLIAAVLAAFVIGGQSRTRSPSGALTGGATRDEALGTVDIDDTFAFDAAARFNERVVANVDAIDTSLTTILAGNVAVLVFTMQSL
jgi:FlaG/FlaF family flagellin (archaellin)